jgi:diguanylate cyclase (GGDEF)-like protein
VGILQLSAFGFLYYLLARFGMALFSLEPGNITLLWLPSGIALVMYHRWGGKAFPFIFLASFASNYPGMQESTGTNPFLHTTISSIADGLAGFVATYFLKRFLPDGLRQTHDLLPFGLWVCLATTLITSIIVSINMAIGGFISVDRIIPFIRMLILADSLGILLIYPIYQSWMNGATLSRQELYWLAGTSANLLILLSLGFTILPGMVFFIFPIILILSFNVRILGVVSISALSLIGIIAATAHNIGPFVATDPMDSNFRLMAFVFSTSLTILGITLQNHQLLLSESSSKVWQIAAEHDPLTGLMNRRAFLPILHTEHERAKRNGRVYTLAVLDLDHFKFINDNYGHLAGDDVLCAVVAIMTENCRSSDSVARIGGEEFAILFPNCNTEEAFLPLERIRANLADNPVKINEKHIIVTVSIGIASFTYGEEDDLNLISRADKALYTAKETGRNKIVIDDGAQRV